LEVHQRQSAMRRLAADKTATYTGRIPYPISKLFDDFQSADVSTTPPSVKMHVTRSEPRFHDWEIYNGFWRGGVALDFGKDLPKFCEGVRVLTSREFVNDLTEAFRAPLVELGSFY